MKKLYTIILCTVLCVFLLSTAVFATDGSRAMRDVKDAVSTAEDVIEDAVTDMNDAKDSLLDPDNGDPEAESDGIVDDDDTALDNSDDSKPGDTTNEQPSSDRDDRDTTDSRSDTQDETTGVIDGMELEENGINPWAIVIAVIVVIAVLILIFILIPKRRH